MGDIKHPMLAALKEVLDEIEAADEKDYKFIESLLIRYEEGRLGELSPKQFAWVFDIHEKFCVERTSRDRLMHTGRFRKP